jgi:hypothetical protein
MKRHASTAPSTHCHAPLQPELCVAATTRQSLSCSQDVAPVKYISPCLWRHVHKQFGGGPDIARWGDTVENGDVLVSEHHALNVSEGASGREAVMYVPGEMPFNKVRDIALQVLKLQEDEEVTVWDCGADDVTNLDTTFVKMDCDANLYKMSFMVRSWLPW